MTMVVTLPVILFNFGDARMHRNKNQIVTLVAMILSINMTV